MYYFEGKDYSKIPSTEDEKRFELMLETVALKESEEDGHVLRHKGASVSHINLIFRN